MPEDGQRCCFTTSFSSDGIRSPLWQQMMAFISAESELLNKFRVTENRWRRYLPAAIHPTSQTNVDCVGCRVV